MGIFLKFQFFNHFFKWLFASVSLQMLPHRACESVFFFFFSETVVGLGNMSWESDMNF